MARPRPCTIITPASSRYAYVHQAYMLSHEALCGRLTHSEELTLNATLMLGSGITVMTAPRLGLHKTPQCMATWPVKIAACQPMPSYQKWERFDFPSLQSCLGPASIMASCHVHLMYTNACLAFVWCCSLPSAHVPPGK